MSTIDIKDIIRSKEIRYTPVRKAVLEYLQRQNRPCSHQDILTDSAVRKFNRVTVYRTLDLFLSVDLIHRIQGQEGAWRFCANQNHNYSECSGNHIHFSCVSCLQMKCLPEVKLPWIESPMGCEIYSKQLVVHGKCENCQ